MNRTDFDKGQTAKSQLFCYCHFNYIGAESFAQVDIYIS